MNLERSIEELLHDHDCVIVPRFGGFIGSYAPARINKTQHTFHPPSKALLFNINLHHNDGLLANHVSAEQHITYVQALDMIHDRVDEWLKTLKEQKRLVIGQIGELCVEQEGNIVFHQNPMVNLLPDSFGLTAYVSPAVSREIPLINPEQGKARSLPAIMKWAAMLALPVGFAIYLGTYHFDRVKDISASYAGIFFSEEPSAIASAVKKQIYVIPKPHRAPAPVQKADPRPDSSKKVSVKPFAIIVGAFRFPENAENLVAQLKNKGYDASVYDVTRGGLSRVTIGTYSEKEEALEYLAFARTSFPSAWLLSK